MPSPSAQAQAHRALQSLRAYDRPTDTVNTADWLHDTVVVNRAEKRAAAADAKRHHCEEVKEKDEARQTRTRWVHGETCPKWRAEEKKPAPKMEFDAGKTEPWPVKRTLAEAIDSPERVA
jgi:hypothetical protein